MNKLYRTFRDKLYPGGEVNFWNIDVTSPMSKRLQDAFKEYLLYFQIRNSDDAPSLFTIANEINLDFDERLRFVKSNDDQKETFFTLTLKVSNSIALSG
ncbi:MAG: hypothetical protein QM734_08280 [Cyclobacteriaceae bacterium]